MGATADTSTLSGTVLFDWSETGVTAVQNGFLQRTPRGRVATAQAYRHFGFNPPNVTNGTQQPTLF